MIQVLMNAMTNMFDFIHPIDAHVEILDTLNFSGRSSSLIGVYTPGCYINLIIPWEESKAGTAGFVSSVSLQTHLPSPSCHTVNPAQPGW